MIECPDCGVHFEVIFNRHPFYTHIEFCPFCGYEITETELKHLMQEEEET